MRAPRCVGAWVSAGMQSKKRIWLVSIGVHWGEERKWKESYCSWWRCTHTPGSRCQWCGEEHLTGAGGTMIGEIRRQRSDINVSERNSRERHRTHKNETIDIGALRRVTKGGYTPGAQVQTDGWLDETNQPDSQNRLWCIENKGSFEVKCTLAGVVYLQTDSTD